MLTSSPDSPLIPQSVLRAAAALGLTYTTLWWRIRRKGLTLDEALACGPPRRRKPVLGVEQQRAAERAGVTAHTIRKRMATYRCTLAEAEALGGVRRGDRTMSAGDVVLDFSRLPDLKGGHHA